MLIDLHTHSTASDGALSPSELVAFAYECGVRTLALTDHDTVEGVAEAADAAETVGLRFIPGIEISTMWGGVCVHIVGLGVNTENPALISKTRELCQLRNSRASRIAERFSQLGIEGMLEAVLELAGNEKNISRLHFARALIAKGIVNNEQRAFDQYLSEGGKAYVPAPWGTVAEAVELIHSAGGLAVIAHPGRYKFKQPWQTDALVQDFVRAGGEGIEVVSGSQSPSYTQQGVIFATQYHLLASLGSDFHRIDGIRPKPGEQGQLPDGLTSVLTRL